MKENLQYLLEDENARKKMGIHARNKALSYDWKYIAQEHEILYKEITEMNS